MTLHRRSLMLSAAALGAAPIMAFAADAPPIAKTTEGAVRGRWIDGVAMFGGIPYGAPTGPGSRFMPLRPPAKWTGVRDATKPGDRAPQQPENVFNMPVGDYFTGGHPEKLMLADEGRSENCLVLNVLTPALDGKKRPVMVYMHGGGYTAGSGIIGLGADKLVREQDVVLVTVNHRLASLGYLYLAGLDPKYADSGNVGHLDLLATLKWVKANIAAFGGDPGRVTIWGESGGGSKISHLLNMPAAKGLFHRAIVASGSALKSLDKATATENARRFIAKLGLKPDQLDKLQTLPVEDLVKASQGIGWGPVVDGRNFLRDPFSPDAPPTAAGVPMLIITCKDEGTLFIGEDPATFKLSDDQLQKRVVDALKVSPTQADQAIATLRKTRPGASEGELFLVFQSERTRASAIAQAERKARQKAGPVYLAYFTWETPVGAYKAFHTADLPLEFRIVRYPQSEALSKRISAAWASFARDGRPTVPGGPAWPAYDEATRATANFDLTATTIENNPRPDDYKVWNLG